MNDAADENKSNERILAEEFASQCKSSSLVDLSNVILELVKIQGPAHNLTATSIIADQYVQDPEWGVCLN